MKDENNNFSYAFWIWSDKFNAVLSMFSYLIEYDILDEERNIIKEELRQTNDEKGIWTDYLFKGKKFQIKFKFAYDAEEGSDMIHIQLETNKTLKEKIEALDLFQSIFKDLIE